MVPVAMRTAAKNADVRTKSFMSDFLQCGVARETYRTELSGSPFLSAHANSEGIDKFIGIYLKLPACDVCRSGAVQSCGKLSSSVKRFARKIALLEKRIDQKS